MSIIIIIKEHKIFDYLCHNLYVPQKQYYITHKTSPKYFMYKPFTNTYVYTILYIHKTLFHIQHSIKSLVQASDMLHIIKV